LRKHNPDYPSAEYLRGVCRVGNENIKDLWIAPPDMETKHTPGEQLIIDTLLDTDPRPVHVLSWGGANTTASALWKLKTAYPKEKFDCAVSRIRIIASGTDGGGWIQTNIPVLTSMRPIAGQRVFREHQRRPRKKAAPTRRRSIHGLFGGSGPCEKGHGPLGHVSAKYVSEGDTPSFLRL
jgi:hypothetical protein